MPAQSRAQRRRANTRQRPYTVPKTYDLPGTEPQDTLPEAAPQPVVQAAAQSAAVASTSNSRVARRLRTRSAPEPVDYTKDYRDVGKDLRLIAIWSVLLFIAMFGLYFARSNGLF